jgi:rhamnosyltransferase
VKFLNGAIVVLFNPTKKDLRNILDYVYKVDRTLIIDNSESNHFDELCSFIKIDNRDVMYKHNKKNLGLSKTMNDGIKYLQSLGCKWVLTMDHDSNFKTNIIDVYKNYIESNNTRKVAVLAPLFDYDRHKERPYEGFKNVNWKMMSGNFLNTNVFLKLNGFKEIFFVDGLDMEYCLHAKEKGYKVIECGQAILKHKPAETRSIQVYGKTIFKYGYASPLRYYYQAKSLTWICIKYRNFEIFMIYLYKLFKILFLFDKKLLFLSNYVKGTKEGIQISKRHFQN